MPVTIDLDKLTLADYPAVVRLVDRLYRSPGDPAVIEEALPILDRVLVGGVAAVPLSALPEVRAAFVVAVMGMLVPKRSGGSSGATSGSAKEIPPSNISPSALPGGPTAATGRS